MRDPYSGEKCCYTGCNVPSPAHIHCRCKIHRNDRYEKARKAEYSYDWNRNSDFQKQGSYMLLLGVDPPLTIEDLKQAFRKKARSTHPDKGGCGDEFIEVKEAYDFLLELC